MVEIEGTPDAERRALRRRPSVTRAALWPRSLRVAWCAPIFDQRPMSLTVAPNVTSH